MRVRLERRVMALGVFLTSAIAATGAGAQVQSVGSVAPGQAAGPLLRPTPSPVADGGAPSIPTTGWEARAAMPAGRWAHGLVSYSTGVYPNNSSFIYVVSGSDSTFNNTALLTRYDVGAGAWDNTLAALPQSRTQMSAVRIGSRIYVPGGYGGSFSPVTTLSIYDIEADEWSTGAPLPTAVGDYAIGVYQDRYLYVIGGYNGSIDVNLVQVYDSVDDEWTAGTPKTNAATAGLRAGIVGNRIIVVGGYSQALAQTRADALVGTIDPLDPNLIAWSPAADYPAGPAGRLGSGVPQAQGPAQGAAALNFVMFTGGDPNGQGVQVLNKTWIYDFNDEAWKSAPDKLTGVSNIVNLTSVSSGGKLYMASTGGYNGISVVTVNEWLGLGAEGPPNLSLAMTHGNASLAPDGSIVYHLDYGIGVGNAENARITDTVPAGAVFDPAQSTAGWACVPDNTAGSVCTFDLGDVAGPVDASIDFALAAVYPTPAGLLEITNTAAIAADAGIVAEVDTTDNAVTDSTPYSIGSLAFGALAGTDTSENGTSVQLQLTLQVAPTTDVTVDFLSTDTTEGSVTPQLVFTPQNWATPQIATVTGIDDAADDGPIAYQVSASIAAGSGNYAGIPIPTAMLVNLDDDPAVGPSVTAVRSVRDTGDDLVMLDESTPRPLTQLLVDFSEPLAPASAPANPSNYRVVGAGPDSQLHTIACSDPLAGDDIELPVAEVIYSEAQQVRAAALLAGSHALSRGNYRLIVCDSLTDTLGNALDGDGANGPGGDFVHDWSASETTAVANVNFDRDLAGWTALSPQPADIAFSPADSEDADTSGSAEIFTADGMQKTYSLSQCLPGNLFTMVSGYVRIQSAVPGSPQAQLHADFYTGDDCTGFIRTLSSASLPGDTSNAFLGLGDNVSQAPRQTGSVRVRFEVQGGDAGTFTVNFDSVEARLVDAIFYDSFESVVEP